MKGISFTYKKKRDGSKLNNYGSIIIINSYQTLCMYMVSNIMYVHGINYTNVLKYLDKFWNVLPFPPLAIVVGCSKRTPDI